MKKAMSLLTATAMAATLLAGCGGGAASSSAAPAADSTSTEATARPQSLLPMQPQRRARS